MHKAMTELNWTPDDVGRLTIPQLICLGSEKPPRPAALRTAEEFLAAAEARKKEDEKWGSR